MESNHASQPGCQNSQRCAEGIGAKVPPKVANPLCLKQRKIILEVDNLQRVPSSKATEVNGQALGPIVVAFLQSADMIDNVPRWGCPGFPSKTSAVL